jgi:arylsulfatase A-like enzyme
METYDWWNGLDLAEKEEGYLTHLITRHAVQFVKEHKKRPFCLYVPHGAVHSPLQGPEDPPGRGPKAAKRKAKSRRPQQETVQLMFQALDESVGAILDTLQEEQIARRTLVLFFSDNGGAKHCKNAPLRGGKGSLWEGGHRVPAIAWWPGRIPPGTVSHEICISLDVMPTLLDIAGLPGPEGRKLDGVSLLPVLKGGSLGPRQLFWNGHAMREGPWKLVTRAKGLRGKPGLYNLAQDIGERNNLAASEPARVRRMLAAVEAWKKDVAKDATPQPSGPPRPPEE